ncbi:MAG: hypothetical protein ACYC8T_09055 [Myxococcaceae bacterium]
MRGLTFISCVSADGGAEGVCARWARHGEACGPDPTLPSSCDQGYCQRAPASKRGVCLALPAAGERCGSSPELSPECADGLYCQALECGASYCRPRKASGEPCAADSECAGESCDRASGRCRTGCNDLARAGCLNGWRDLSYYLFFAAALGAGRRPLLRARRSAPGATSRR